MLDSIRGYFRLVGVYLPTILATDCLLIVLKFTLNLSQFAYYYMNNMDKSDLNKACFCNTNTAPMSKLTKALSAWIVYVTYL